MLCGASEDEAAMQQRYQTARVEIAHYGLFVYVIVNDELQVAVDQLRAILLAEECKRERTARRAESLLEPPVLR